MSALRHRLTLAALGLPVLIAPAVTLLAAEHPAAPAPTGTPANNRLAASALLDSPAKTPTAQAGEKAADKLREGTRLSDELGSFSRVGERVSFAPGGNREALRCLENLQLERVARAIEESQGQRQWVVSGTITEFRGANYLLITKAVIRLQEGETASGP
jgi:hypothetical protein